MPNESRMLNMLFKKVSGNPEYFAWYFKKYMDFENKTLPELLDELKIDENKLYHVGLCKAPNAINKDFSKIMKSVADFADMNLFPLLKIVRSVNNVNYFNSNPQSVGSNLMAAREKDLPDTHIKDK